MLATASFVFSAPLDTTAPFFNSTSNTNSLGFFGFGDDIYSWTVNFFSRPNCENTCVDTLYCPSALARATGDLPGSDQWSSVEGKWCWDVPEQLGKGGGSIGLSLSKHAVKKGRYVGTAMNCTVRHELGMFGEKRRLIAGKSKNAEKGMCNYGGGLADDIQAVVFELAE